MVGIIGVIFTINAQVALITFGIFTLFYWIISSITKKALQKNSQLIADQSTQMVKSLQEGLGGIRDVLIDNSQEFYCKLYRNADLSLRRASGDNVFIGQSPRYIMEAIGMALIATMAYTLTVKEGGSMAAIPILGTLAVSAQKLLPVLHQAYHSYSAIKGSESSFIDVLNLLNQPLSRDISGGLTGSIAFEKEILFKNVSFRYEKDEAWVLKDINLSFKKGETVGFIGVTGCGKSTLLDILMGLLTPTMGEISIDGVYITQQNRRAWQAHISHVPQSIYLADSTIQKNIAFSIKSGEIKNHKVIQAAHQAQIAEVIDNLKDKYQTFVGERGVQLSGGQRQRIGIARALYKDSNVLILDEATSALDNETEKKIMQQISQLENEQTVFIIAHRLTTLKQCDRIIRVNEDYTIEEVNYNQVTSGTSLN